jgi:hypothetical protein
MSSVTFYEAALGMLRNRMADYSQTLISGHMEDYAQYRGLCGRLQGLREAEEDLKNLYGRMYDRRSFREGVEDA